MHDIRLFSTRPVGAALAVELGGTWHSAIVYQRTDEGALYEATRLFGRGIDGERQAVKFVRERNADLKRWLAARKG